ncbi:hypothetical protein [Acetivibrio cellulolyticus]|uniref:hypothetical protein n=1 Tax=Acetivibrio cellulolyticus TaxID=35830 RepID=UPI0001E3015A|nr:hypothetical protein [Acetivibrio cellulolyticus]
MDNTNNQEIVSDIKKKETHFWGFWNKFFRGEETEESLADRVTQPFWQSTQISKKRLDQKGLLLDVNIYEDGMLRMVDTGVVDAQTDGSNIVQSNSRDVIAERKIYRGEKLIYKQKNKEISHVHLLKSKVIGDSAECPNCGHLGKIAAFIDGCDYCGAKYVVNDFETKVSGFSLEENTYKKSRSTFFKGLLALGIITVLIVALGIFSFIVLISLLQAGNNGKEAIASLLPGLFAITYVPALLKSLMLMLFLFAILGVFLYLFYQKNILGEEKVKAVIPNFSAYDFYQNLEYKLRSIHMADDAHKVSSFATFDLGNLVANYKNVVDCSMTRLVFQSAGKNGSQYEIEAVVTLRLFWYDGKRIKNCYEKVKCRLSGTDAILKNNYFAIQEYKCPDCGGNINILDGGNCEYCKTKLDYSKIGWMLSDYQIIKKNSNIYRNIKVVMILLYIAVLVFQFGAATKKDGTFNQLFQFNQHTDEIMDIVFHMVPLPEQMEPSLKQISYTDQYRKRLYLYDASWENCTDYRDYLLQHGCKLVSEEEESSIILNKIITAEDLEQQALKETKSDALTDLIRTYVEEDGVMQIEIRFAEGETQIIFSVDEL